MDVIETSISAVKIIQPKKFGDDRGVFSETWNQRALEEAGIDLPMVQDNHALSGQIGTVRGLHFQRPPFSQAKLVRVVRGAIFDVAVDLRRSSPTYGQYVSATISADEWNQILVPADFAHGYCTLNADTEVIYKVSNYWSPDHESGIRWNDPDIGIEWPVPEADAVLIDRDRELPLLKDIADDLPF